MAEHTPGPWHWEVSERSRSVVLINARTDYVMGLNRWGMQSAAPTFPVGGIMRNVSTMLTAFPGRQHHRDWCADIEHVNARLIAAAPDLLAACEDALGTLTHAPLEAEEDRVKWPVRQTIEKLLAAVKRAKP